MIVKWTPGQLRTVRLKVNEWNGLKSAFGARPCFEGVRTNVRTSVDTTLKFEPNTNYQKKKKN